nr:response regulator transcription factor [Wenzhouxiangella limi]
MHVDDHPAIIQAARACLVERFPGVEYVGVGSHEEGQALMEQGAFDVVILDLSVDGSVTLRKIKEYARNTPTIIWSMRYNYGVIRTALDYGTRGFVGKHEPIAVLEKAIEAVLCSKKFYLSAEGQAILSDGGLSTSFLSPGFYQLGVLSPRELQVLRLTGKGFCIQETAEALGVKPKTVETFRRRIREKLALGSAHHLAPFAVRWVSDGEPLYLKYP